MKPSSGLACCILIGLGCLAGSVVAAEEIDVGGRLPQGGSEAVIWWALSSAAKIQPDAAPPEKASAAVRIRCARNEREAAQVVVRPAKALRQVAVEAGPLTGPGQSRITGEDLEVLRAAYLEVSTPSDNSTRAGLWPDPLIPVQGRLDLLPGTNQALWLRVRADRETPAGVYRGAFRLAAEGWRVEIPVELAVYGFALPDRMTCQTAFGFSPGEVFRYHGVSDEASRRAVLEKYWANLSAHHISPYNPAPLDPIQVTWPKVEAPKVPGARWRDARLVRNEAHSGKGALLVYDDKPNQTAMVSYESLIAIPPKGLRLRGWYRTAVPGHRFTVSLNHYDANRQWMSGRNRDMVLAGDGRWQSVDVGLNEFPAEARYVRLYLMGSMWTEGGENLGLVWFDDISIQNAEMGEELVEGGDFEPKTRTELCAPVDQLRATFDFAAWDRAMTRAFEVYHFNSFSVPIPGLGSGTFHELAQPNLRGFAEDDPEYPLLLGSYCRQMEAHLRTKDWLDRAFVYWFDEPSEDQYGFVLNGFNKLKRYCPDIPRMITEEVVPELIGGPNLWCPISNNFRPERAKERQALGERFWWYVCTGPKAPYAGLFLDHAAPEMRIWLWQTFQRDINGILVWQCNYWNSGTAYPDAAQPQNPYADPMSWMTGYGTPAGKKSPWGNGDGRFIYPPPEAATGRPATPIIAGPVDSIRWEHLRDGIEDYEYLTILRTKLEERRAGLSAEQAEQYAKLLLVPGTITRSMTEFTPDGAPIERRRHEVARAIESLGGDSRR